MGEKRELLHHLPPDQVFLNNSLKDRWGCTVIPDAVRVNQQNGSLLADLQAISLGPKHRGGTALYRPIKLQFPQPPLEVVPSFKAGGFVTTFRVSLIGTEKNMVADSR
jgi:hypothetical protein